jgi:hypothetical protein
MRYFFFGMIFLLPHCLLRAQSHCGTSTGHTPSPLIQFEKIFKNPSSGNLKTAATIYRIPVVFHVIHWEEVNSTGELYGTNENIPDEYLDNSLVILNEDFRKKTGSHGGTNPTATDTKIEFYKTTVDPVGAPSSGILRVVSESTLEFSYGITPFPSAKWEGFMNIYVVQSLWAGFYGWATIGGNDMVVDYRMFAPVANSNVWYTSILTHETGHALSLFHTYDALTSCLNNNCLEDGDKVCDTEPTTYNGGVCSSTSLNTCTTDANAGDPNNPFTTDQHDDLYNYVAGGDLECKNKFTQGQIARMRAFVETGIFDHTTSEEETSVKDSQTSKPKGLVFPNPASEKVFVTVTADSYFEIMDPMGKPLSTGVTGYEGIPVSFLSDGIYFIRITAPSGEQILTDKFMIQSR